jgi:hypothetical protein
MNEFSPFRVWTERGVMYVSPDHPFADGMEIDQAGRVSYPGEAPDPAADLRLAQAINSYAKAYAEALAAGEVGLPSGADCWGCVMRTDSGDNPLGSDGEHLREHIRERYYVPALLSLARDFRRLAPAAQDWIARKMHNAPTNGWPGDDYGKRETAKAIRSYMRHALGLSA